MEKYVFKAYSKNFPELFEKEKNRIASHIKKSLAIEHIGSTSIPNLGGKGIIDIAIAIEKEEINLIAKFLQQLGYEIKAKYCTPDRLFLKADLLDDEQGIRSYHVHLTHLDSKDWKDFIAFRDYLRNHPKEAQIYAELKKKASEEVNEDGEKYREIKKPLIQIITTKIEKGEK